MRTLVSVLLLAVACTAVTIPQSDEPSLTTSPPPLTAVALGQQQLDIIGNTGVLIEQLVENLHKAAKEAIEAVDKFREGIIEQAKLIQEKIVAEIEKLRDRVENVFQSAYDKFMNSGKAIQQCIDTQRLEAETVFNDTMKDSIACADDRIKEIGDQLDSLTSLANNASEFASGAMDEMRNCVDKHQPNMMSVGSCLAGVALRTEMRGAVFVTQSGLQIGRLNLALATLPASLEVCAGTRLVQASTSAARMVMEIGSCSATSIFSFANSPTLLF